MGKAGCTVYMYLLSAKIFLFLLFLSLLAGGGWGLSLRSPLEIYYVHTLLLYTYLNAVMLRYTGIVGL